MKYTMIASAFLLGLASSLANADSYTIVQTTQSTIGSLTKTDYTVQVGANPVNQFKMHRVIKTDPAATIRGTVILLNPLGQGFSSYEYDESGNYSNSTPGYLAERGIEVFGYTPREFLLAPNSCETGAADCSQMQFWGIQTIVNDAEYIRQFIADLHGSAWPKPVVGGLSLGAMSTIATVNANPTGYKAAIVWEGMLYSNDTVVKTLNQTYCATDQAQMTAGAYYNGQLLGTMKTLAQNAKNDPLGAAGAGHLAFVTFMSNPPPTPVTAPVPGYYFLDGNIPQNKFVYASDVRAEGAVINTFGNYAVTKQIVDVNCSIAGDRTFTGNLSAFTGPVFALGGGHGFGGHFGDNLALFGSTSVQINTVADFGHVDHYLNGNHVAIVEQPIYAWLSTIVFP
jgi:hypothetical protein